MAKVKYYTLPEGKYHPTFLKALAMAAHTETLDPSELDYWFETEWTQLEMAKEIYERVK